MRYENVKPGMTVLVSGYRRSHRNFTITAARLATVEETGLSHDYTAWVSEGWSGGRRVDRHTEQGIRLTVKRHDRRDPRAGHGPLPEFYETVTTAAFLFEFDGDDRTMWESARATQAARETRDAARLAREADVTARLTRAGLKAEVKDGAVTFTLDEAEALLRIHVEAPAAGALS